MKTLLITSLAILCLLWNCQNQTPSTKFENFVREGQNYQIRGDYPNAIQSFELAREMDNQNANVLQNLCALYWKQKEWSLVHDRCRHAIRLQPETPLPYIALAQAYISIGEYAYATNHLERLLRVDPKNARAYFHLAQIAQIQGKTKQAETLSNFAETYAKAQDDSQLLLEIQKLKEKP